MSRRVEDLDPRCQDAARKTLDALTADDELRNSGVAGGAERLAAWDAYAESLRAINDTEGWFRDPQWPTKPEV